MHLVIACKQGVDVVECLRIRQRLVLVREIPDRLRLRVDDDVLLFLELLEQGPELGSLLRRDQARREANRITLGMKNRGCMDMSLSWVS